MEVSRWAELPDPVLYSIMTRLPTVFDLMAFSGVCSAWRSAFADAKRDCLASVPPLLMARSLRRPLGFKLCTLPGVRYRCYAREFYWDGRWAWLGVSCGRLILAKRPHFMCLMLVDLRSGAKTRLPDAPRGVDKAVLLPPSSEAPEGLLLGWQFAWTGTHTLCFCVLGAGCMRWTKQRWQGSSLRNVLPSNDGRKVFAVTTQPAIFVMDLVLHPEPALVVTDSLPVPPGRNANLFLAQVGSQLMIACPSKSGLSARAYGLDTMTRGWVELSTLGGRNVFVSRCECLASDVPVSREIERDCIYFLGYKANKLLKFTLHDKKVEYTVPRGVRVCRGDEKNCGWVSPMYYYNV